MMPRRAVVLFVALAPFCPMLSGCLLGVKVGDLPGTESDSDSEGTTTDPSPGGTGIVSDTATGFSSETLFGSSTFGDTIDGRMTVGGNTTQGPDDGETIGVTLEGSGSGWLDESGGTGPVDAGFGDCDPYAQDCVGGEKCTPLMDPPDAFVTNMCVPIDRDPDQPYLPCTRLDDVTDTCAWGSVCITPDLEPGEGLCVLLCIGSSDAPICELGQCLEVQGGYGLCPFSCNPVLGDCLPETACHAQAIGFACLPSPPEPAEVGEPCAVPVDCAAGTTCTPAAQHPSCAGTGCCAPFCDPTADDCALEYPSTVCAPWDEGPVPAEIEPVGTCVLPA